MSRTSPLAIALIALLAAAVAWLLEWMLVMTGRPALVPPVTLGPALALLAVVLLLLAWPVRQAARGARRIDYRHATSVLGFAKASSVVGALLGGAALGALGFFGTRAVVAGDAVLTLAIVAGGALMQLVAGLVAEHWCVLPPDDEDDATAAAGSAA
ncbi:DUF3180 family protein [Agrococcus carbonis]|uniref:DUF3180 domain-containing protein n=1 Tax=Agrococcus carbonis TaxID=684552 RepID=A0A1H1QDM9_9MICO|nr:DUF3180 family protein [Agrococcus carbonis]SDS21387.1 Protein of unknown function [Agrococcus carbonis]